VSSINHPINRQLFKCSRISDFYFIYFVCFMLATGGGSILPDIAHDPIAIGLFGAIGVVVIPQDLSNLIHEPEFRTRSEFFEFSMLSTISPPKLTSINQLDSCEF